MRELERVTFEEVLVTVAMPPRPDIVVDRDRDTYAVDVVDRDANDQGGSPRLT